MTYRDDIDGLRALAVLAVLLFHFEFEIFSGGYVGVDVFFVISGYLITSILIHDIQAQRFSLSHFYEKRLRRLFPALFATVLVSWGVGYWLFMPDEFKEFGQSMVSTVAYLSNVFFWMKSDYFGGPSELKPLLHTWSLSVEEQYYLIFPFVVWGALKSGIKALLKVTIVLLGISFVASVLMIKPYPSAVFYLSPFRFWELLIGSLLAIFAYQKVAPSKKAVPFLSSIGLALILWPIFVYTEKTAFPGWSALWPVIGASLIIWANDTGWVGKLLKLPFMRFTGKISYSLYLWHWPLVVFYGYWIIRDFTLLDKLMLLVVTFILGWLSWRYLESPFRLHGDKQRKPKWVFAASIVATLGVLAVGGHIWKTKGVPDRFPQLVKTEALSDVNQQSKSNPCFLNKEQGYTEWGNEACLIDSPKSDRLVLLWGDSHAFHLLAGLKANQDNLDFDVLMYASAGCAPILGLDLPGRPNCKANNDYALEILAKYQPKELILAGNWSYGVKEENVKLAELVNTVEKAKTVVEKVTVFNQLPLYPISNPQYLAMRLQQSNVTSDYYLKPSEGKDSALEISGLLPEDMVYDAYGLFCPEVACSIFRDGSMMVVDRGHLSKEGSKYLIESYLKERRETEERRDG